MTFASMCSGRHCEPLVKIAGVAALLALVAGCAGTREIADAPVPAVTGDQRGGKIPNGVNDTPAAMNAAIAHCAKFGKKAVITQMAAPSEGGLMAFECH